ncbi:protein SRC2 homolog [Manihot esculenta]|uniref:C2 domain-containing protein n=1 Tax=Manihot esculenta TaxID=3983 RepID=A0A2C9W2I1_MANES|nr:protein SRC2 homolog [Manihot esculenta]OAY52610.1 hypothetical protein MANES_04G097000v8 [Manihot esculenta]
MDSKSLELKVMYCKDLKSFNFFQKLLVYALVKLESDDSDKKMKQNQQHRTPTDAEGDGNPEWNYEMQFDLSEFSFVDCDHIFIHFDLRHEGLYFGDKTIGEVRVPLKDLIQESSGIVRFVNYQVRSPDGKPNGLLNFSYKVHAKGEAMGIHFPTSEISGYSVVHHHHQSPEIQYSTSEVESLSPVVHYPSLELEDSPQETYCAAQESYPSHRTQYYPPGPAPAPAPYAYGPPSMPPPPPPLLHQPPPHPHGACYLSPYPPYPRPWAPGGVYDHNAHENWSSPGRQSHSFGYGETWRNDFGAY